MAHDFLSSFLYLDVLLSYQDIKLLSLSIDESSIDKKKIKLINANSTKENTKRYNFGFECVVNDKNEKLIIMIGGRKRARNIDLFNCVTYELTCHQQVSPIYIRYYILSKALISSIMC